MQANHNSLYRGYRSIARKLSIFREKPRIEITFNYCHDLSYIPDIQAPDGCEIRNIGYDDISLLLDVWPVPLEQMIHRLDRGDQCYSAFLFGRIAHYQWVQMNGKHHIQPANRWFQINDREMVFFHSRVAEWARGKRLYSYVNTYILRQSKASNYSLAWIYTTAGNLSSQKGIERAGWSFAEGYRAIKWGNIYIPLPGKLMKKPATSKPMTSHQKRV